MLRLVLLVYLAQLTIDITAAEPVRLTNDGLIKRDVSYMADGKHISYVWLENPAQLRLMKLNVQTKIVEPLHKDVTKTEFEPAFSSDGQHYTFIQSRGNLSLALVIRNLQTGKQTEIPPGGGFSGLRSPAFSADGKRVLYAYPVGGRQHLFSVDLAAKDRKQLTDSPGVNNWPDCSPDGKQIVFSSTRDGNYDVYIMDSDGTNVKRLTTNPRQDIRPRFSPDGKQITFTSTRDGNYEIYVINTDGSNLRRVTNHLERDDYPAWHPDGKRLLVVSERAGKHDLYLVDVPAN